MRHPFRNLLTLALTALLATAALAAPARERWYVVEMQGQRAGWMREYERTTEDGLLVTGSEMRFEMGRGQASVSITIESEFVETAAHEPVEMTVVQKLGLRPATTRYVWRDGEVRVVSEQGGQRSERTVEPPEGDWMTPLEALEHTHERLEAGAEEIRTATLTPLTGMTVVDSVMRVQGETTVEVLGKVVPALKATVETSMMAGAGGVQYIDEQGRPLRFEQNMGAFTMVVLASEKAVALADLDPPEMMASTFVKPTGEPIRAPRDARRARYRLTLEGDGEIPVYSGGFQAARENGGGVVVEMDLDRVDRAHDVDRASLLASTSMLGASDPRIVELTERALRGAGASDAARAEAVRAFVAGYIDEKGLGVGFATASEVARTRQGDCSEHAVLTAAMLRAAGIPSRVVSGLVYTQAFAGARDVFGYHAWAQALVEDGGGARWIDVDATLGDQAFDAAHIALGASSMGDGDFTNGLASLAPLIGRLKIETLEIE